MKLFSREKSARPPNPNASPQKASKPTNRQKARYKAPIPPGDHTPHFAEKDAYIGKGLSVVFGLVSGYFTYKFLSLFLGTEDALKTGLVFGISAGVTFFEWWLFRRAVLRNSLGAAIIGCLIALISIAGSFGAYQGAYVQNMLNSDAYQLKKRQVQAWLAMSDKKSNPNGYMWSATKAEKAQKELDQVKQSGAGAGNAVFGSVARYFDTDPQTAADNMNTLLSILFEIAFIAMTLFSAFDEKRSFWENQSQDAEPDEANSGNGNAVNAIGTPIPQETGNGVPPKNTVRFGFHPSTAKTSHPPTLPAPAPKVIEKVVYREKPVEKIQYVHTSGRVSIEELNNRKRQRMNERLAIVKNVLRDYPDLSQVKQAQRAGLSLNTFKKYKAMIQN